MRMNTHIYAGFFQAQNGLLLFSCCLHIWVCDILLNNAVSSLWSFLWFYGQQPHICVKVFCRFYIIILFLYILLLRGKTFWRFFIVFRHRLLFHSFSVLSLYLTILLSYLTMTDKSFKHKTARDEPVLCLHRRHSICLFVISENTWFGSFSVVGSLKMPKITQCDRGKNAIFAPTRWFSGIY